MLSSIDISWAFSPVVEKETGTKPSGKEALSTIPKLMNTKAFCTYRIEQLFKDKTRLKLQECFKETKAIYSNRGHDSSPLIYP